MCILLNSILYIVPSHLPITPIDDAFAFSLQFIFIFSNLIFSIPFFNRLIKPKSPLSPTFNVIFFIV